MSGITLKDILLNINRFEAIRIEDEFARDFFNTTPYEALEELLTAEQLSQTFDYIRTVDGKITIGMNSDIYRKYFSQF